MALGANNGSCRTDRSRARETRPDRSGFAFPHVLFLRYKPPGHGSAWCVWRGDPVSLDDVSDRPIKNEQLLLWR